MSLLCLFSWVSMLAGTLVYPPGLWDLVAFCLVGRIPVWVSPVWDRLWVKLSWLALVSTLPSLAAHAHHAHLYIILRPIHGRARFRIA